MGQQSSKSHAPLTFGYINHKQPNEQDTITIERYLNSSRRRNGGRNRSNHTPADFVLNNPHLYKLEMTCQQCSQKRDSEVVVVVAEQVNTACNFCKQNKRLSLVRQDLASDLNYIDQTYYPNIVHYDESEEEAEAEVAAENQEEEEAEEDEEEEEELESDYIISDDEDTLRDEEEEGWSKLTIGEVTTLPKRLVPSQQFSVDLSGKSLIKLSSSIGYLSNLTKLDLSDNQMINLPKAIGQLKNLRIFNASKNQLESIPDTIIGLKKLKAINLSQNRLVNLPKGIGSLPSLIILILNQNQLTELPREIAKLNDLITLNVSNNPLKSIPAEIATLKSLRKFNAENCAFETEFVYDLVHDPPSLFEICARNIVKSKKNKAVSAHLSQPFADYFKKEQTCSFCYGPFFDSFVTRGKFIERTNRQLITLDYKLCSAHWVDEEDRITAMFSTASYRQQKPAEIIVDGLLTPSSSTDEMTTPPVDYFHHVNTNTFTSSPSSSSAAAAAASPLLRPRASSASSSSLLRIQTMQQQLHHHLSSTFLRHNSTPLPPTQEQNNGLEENNGLSFATLNSSQSEHVNRILHTSSSSLSLSVIDQPRTVTKKSNGRAIKDSFAQLSVRLGRRGGRDRSGTL
ncbi:hypothetical protein BD770DRAFT_447373 [Pilaira anomala]|nr:hypothetical protein BD770DRAFT_447373 [Pilaira anomala]